ncbi:MAG TPA: HlyD family efflux transporter periplasmic adaptor subunit, partial [Polyangia bacterium]|nr:HlyD family efflux transporter periplasmic adaptor subunit [Polyangia bacterium]
ILVSGAVLLGLALRPRPQPVEAARVTRGPLRVTIDEEGRTQVKRRYVVSAPLTGKLLRVELNAGDHVDEGAVLARLVPADAPLLDPRARAEQEARLHASEAAVAQADANVARARVAGTSAADDLTRKRRLAGSSAISARDLELAESEAAARTQDLASAEFGAKVAAHQLSEAHAALLRGRSGRIDEFAIAAPASGQVLRVIRQSEGVVSAGSELVEIGDPSVLEVAVELLTVEAVRVRPGMAAYIDHWGGPGTLAARVRSVEPSGFTKVSALGVEEQRVRVILDLTAPASDWRALGDHFRVEAHIVAWQTDATLRLPTAALFRRGDAWATYEVVGGRAQTRRLQVGQQSSDVAAINGGIGEGALVILRPGESLADGARIAAITTDLPAPAEGGP